MEEVDHWGQFVVLDEELPFSKPNRKIQKRPLFYPILFVIQENEVVTQNNTVIEEEEDEYEYAYKQNKNHIEKEEIECSNSSYPIYRTMIEYIFRNIKPKKTQIVIHCSCTFLLLAVYFLVA